MRDIDIKEEDSIRCFVAEECGCTLFNVAQMFLQITIESGGMNVRN